MPAPRANHRASIASKSSTQARSTLSALLLISLLAISDIGCSRLLTRFVEGKQSNDEEAITALQVDSLFLSARSPYAIFRLSISSCVWSPRRGFLSIRAASTCPKARGCLQAALSYGEGMSPFWFMLMLAEFETAVTSSLFAPLWAVRVHRLFAPRHVDIILLELLLNVDVSAGVMYQSGPLIGVCCSFLRRSNDPSVLARLGNRDWLALKRFLVGLKVLAGDQSTQRRPREIKNLSTKPANQLTFRMRRGGQPETEITVAHYFQTVTNRPLSFPNLPCVEVCCVVA